MQSHSLTRAQRTPDGLVLDLPVDFQRRNDFCFGKNVSYDNEQLLLGQAEFCVRRFDSHALAMQQRLDDPGAASAACMDCRSIRNQRTDSVLIDGRSINIERALLSGTIHHYIDKPAMLIRVGLAEGGGAVLIAEYELPYDTELIRIAASIRLR